jgi:hypothetical protein
MQRHIPEDKGITREKVLMTLQINNTLTPQHGANGDVVTREIDMHTLCTFVRVERHGACP